MQDQIISELQDDGASTTSGSGATPDDPVWFLITEPTQEQVNATKTGHKTFNKRLRKWQWWLQATSDVSHIEGFNSGGHFYIGDRYFEHGKDKKHGIPSVHERKEMREAGVIAVDNFFTSLTIGDEGERVQARSEVWSRIEPILSIIQTGDLPAAIAMAKNLDISANAGPGNISYNQKQRFIRALEDEMIYFPDYQDENSTSKDRTIQHHTPTPLTSSGTT